MILPYDFWREDGLDSFYHDDFFEGDLWWWRSSPKGGGLEGYNIEKRKNEWKRNNLE
jgi:hypothetical protein